MQSQPIQGNALFTLTSQKITPNGLISQSATATNTTRSAVPINNTASLSNKRTNVPAMLLGGSQKSNLPGVSRRVAPVMSSTFGPSASASNMFEGDSDIPSMSGNNYMPASASDIGMSSSSRVNVGGVAPSMQGRMGAVGSFGFAAGIPNVQPRAGTVKLMATATDDVKIEGDTEIKAKDGW